MRIFHLLSGAWCLSTVVTCQPIEEVCDPGDNVKLVFDTQAVAQLAEPIVSGPCTLERGDGNEGLGYRDYWLLPNGEGSCAIEIRSLSTGERVDSKIIDYTRSADCCSFATACPSVLNRTLYVAR